MISNYGEFAIIKNEAAVHTTQARVAALAV